MENKVYPVSEIFTSPQGEGVYAGQMQCFIRLAGCTVGKPYTKEKFHRDIGMDMEHGSYHFPLLPNYTDQCHLYDGRTFPCDTNYRVKERLTADQILERIPDNVFDVCITGGEPLMHDLTELTDALDVEHNIHLETSGTIIADFLVPHKWSTFWLTVSPKKNCILAMLQRANEIKLLVDDSFNPEKEIVSGAFPIRLADTTPVFLQPVNNENTINKHNLALCREWQIKYPQFRISFQGHKVMSEMLGELVR